MIRFLTAGESHGKGLSVIIEGFPSNLNIDIDYINYHLKRRQAGYGRGQRMKIESDTAEVISGLRFGKTLGSPVSFFIKNKDWENWKESMDPLSLKNEVEKITIPRPGHTDLVGVSKYNFKDIRNSIERSSARETAARVAAGTLARIYLEHFGIYVGSFVESIGGVMPSQNFAIKLLENKIPASFNALKLAKKADESDVRVFEKNHETAVINKIREAKKKGDTLGGTFYIVASGVPAGLGSFVHYDRKIDARIAMSVMSINAVKAVSIGAGFESSAVFGSQSHDEIIKKGDSLSRKTNRAGGIEGGVTTGLPIVIKAAMKPIATLMSPVESVDLKTMKKVQARRERSDFVAVPACAVIGESMLAWTLAECFNEKFGGDSIEETMDNYKNYKSKLMSRISKNFRRK